MRLIDADALLKVFNSLDNKFGVGGCGDGIGICMDALVKAPTIMDLRPRMTEEKLNEITSRVTDIFRHVEFYDCIMCDDCTQKCIECEEEHTVYSLLNIIASLHNELYKEVKGKYYDYMFHWANLGYGGSPDDSMFKDQKEVKNNE